MQNNPRSWFRDEAAAIAVFSFKFNHTQETKSVSFIINDLLVVCGENEINDRIEIKNVSA